MHPAANAYCGTVTIHGETIPRVTVPQCKVCAHVHRDSVDAMLLEGRAYSTIICGLPPGHSLTERNVSEHALRGHASIDEAMTASMKHVSAANKDAVVEVVPSPVSTLLQPVADATARRLSPALRLAERIVQRAYERLEEGDLDVDIKDALAAATLLERYAPAPATNAGGAAEDLDNVIRLVKEIFGKSERYREFQFSLGLIPWTYFQLQ